MFTEIFSIIAPVLICAGIGFFWAKCGKPYDTELITSIVSYFGTPCLLFYSLATVKLAPQTLYIISATALSANAAFIVIGGCLLALLKLPQRAFLQTLSFPNIGNIGLPLCFLAFGEEGLALGITFFAVYVIFQMTIGAAFVSGSFSPASLIKIPIIPATLFAVFFLFTKTPIPEWLYNTTKLIGDLTIPLMLFTLGVSLSRLKVKNLFIPLILSVSRLSMGFAVGILLVYLFQLSGAVAGVVIIECAMPAAVFCYLFAQLYNQRPEDVAGTVVVSTILSFILLPALLWFVL